MPHFKKEHLLFAVLACIFVGNTLLAEMIGPKMFSLEKSFGFQPVNWSFMGLENLSFNYSAGSILWPIVFIMTDVINEYFGKRGVRFLSYTTIGVISYAFLMLFLTVNAAPADFWLAANADIQPDINAAFHRLFGQGMLIIVGSLITFLVAQLVDAFLFQRIMRWTGGKYVWLRATGSTFVSQLLDSFLILIIVFYIGQDAEHRWTWNQIIALGLMAYLYKVVAAIVLTPLLYLVHGVIRRWLGEELAERLKEGARDKK